MQCPIQLIKVRSYRQFRVLCSGKISLNVGNMVAMGKRVTRKTLTSGLK